MAFVLSDPDFVELTKLITWSLGFGNHSDITRDSEFVTDMDADSIDILNIVMDVEDKFDVEIPDDDLHRIVSVGALERLIAAQIAKKAEIA